MVKTKFNLKLNGRKLEFITSLSIRYKCESFSIFYLFLFSETEQSNSNERSFSSFKATSV